MNATSCSQSCNYFTDVKELPADANHPLNLSHASEVKLFHQITVNSKLSNFLMSINFSFTVSTFNTSF
jgi:hypothetical protein